MKVSRSDHAQHLQAQYESNLVFALQAAMRDDERDGFAQLVRSFVFHDHVCMVMELCGPNLYDVLQGRSFRGLPLSAVRSVATNLFAGLVTLERCQVVHADIKPENIVVSHAAVKVIDFGSARRGGAPLATYVQSRYYRAPEVVLHLVASHPIDVWSVGCVLIELFTGIPLFVGQNELQLLEYQTKFLGPIPRQMIDTSPRKDEFFDDEGVLKSERQWCQEQAQDLGERFNCIGADDLEGVIMGYEGGDEDDNARAGFLDLIRRAFEFDPNQRITPNQALQHPFMTDG
jgi:serine/threonine protein kinase